jgi:hypothetical protein
MKRFLIVAVLSVSGLFLADALALWMPIPPGRPQYGVVQVRRYYAMPLKGNKTEFGDAGVENVTCAYALFPHSGYAPCWYASRHKVKWVTE